MYHHLYPPAAQYQGPPNSVNASQLVENGALVELNAFYVVDDNQEVAEKPTHDFEDDCGDCTTLEYDDACMVENGVDICDVVDTCADRTCDDALDAAVNGAEDCLVAVKESRDCFDISLMKGSAADEVSHLCCGCFGLHCQVLMVLN